MARDDARRAARERRHLTLLQSDPASAPAVDEAVHAEAERSRVRTALEQLTPRDREVLLLWDAGLSRSEEHTSELQSRLHLVCRLLLEKKKKIEQRIEVQPHSLSTDKP